DAGPARSRVRRSESTRCGTEQWTDGGRREADAQRQSPSRLLRARRRQRAIGRRDTRGSDRSFERDGVAGSCDSFRDMEREMATDLKTGVKKAELLLEGYDCTPST